MTHPESLPPRPARKERMWTCMLLPGTAWMSVFFVSSLLLLIALSFGTTDALGNPRFGSPLDNVFGIFNPTYVRVIATSLVYAVRATRRALQERAGGPACGAVLRQLSGADVRLAYVAVRREHADDLSAPTRG